MCYNLRYLRSSEGAAFAERLCGLCAIHAELSASQRTGALSSHSVVGYRLLERAHVPLPKPAQTAMMEPELALKVQLALLHL